MPNPIDNLSHEKRIVLAGALCLLVAVVFSRLFAPTPPPKSAEAPLIDDSSSPSMLPPRDDTAAYSPSVDAGTETATASVPSASQNVATIPSASGSPLYQKEPLAGIQKITVDTPKARYIFSTQGGNLRSCRLKNYEEIDPPIRLLEAQRDQAQTMEIKAFWEQRIEEARHRLETLGERQFIPKGKPVPEGRWVELVPQLNDCIGYPLSLRFGEGLDDHHLIYQASADHLEVKNGETGNLELVAETATGIRFKKTLTFNSERETFEIQIETESPGGVAEIRKTLGRHWILEWPDGICHLPFQFPGAQEENKLRAMLNDSMESLTLKKTLLKEGLNKGHGLSYRKTLDGRVGWVNIETRYFLSSFVPQSAGMQGVYILPRLNEHPLFAQVDTRMGIGLISSFVEEPKTVLVYAGPKLTGILEKVAIGLDRVVYDSWFETLDKICRFVDVLLASFYSVIPSYGIAIILLCILSKILLYPLTYKQAQMQKKMAVLQPKIQELKEKYADDPQKLQQEQMKLWKKHGVSPAGCLPMFAQLPIFIALYRTIMASIEMRGAPFLWIHDLSLPDMTFFIPMSLPFLGNAINVLPFVMTGISALQMHQQKKNMADPNQSQIMMFMTVFFFFILYNFSSGLVLYWMTNSLTMMVQQKIMENLGHAHVPAYRSGGKGVSVLEETELTEEETGQKKGPKVPVTQNKKGKRPKKRNR